MDLLVYDSNKTNCSSACVDLVESTMPFGRYFLALLMATQQSTEQKTCYLRRGDIFQAIFSICSSGGVPTRQGDSVLNLSLHWVDEQGLLARRSITWLRTQYHGLSSWFSKNVASLGLWHLLVSWGNSIVENEMLIPKFKSFWWRCMNMIAHRHTSTQALRNTGCKKITIRACMTDKNDWAIITPSHGEICCTIGRWITLVFPALPFTSFFPSFPS